MNPCGRHISEQRTVTRHDRSIQKIWRFAGEERANINKSAAVKFINAVFHMLEVSAIYFIIVALTQGETGSRAAWTALAFMAVSIIGNAVTTGISKNQQTHAGYFMAANERIQIGNLLKGVPMGFFNENSLGEVTGSAQRCLEISRRWFPWCWWISWEG